MAPKGIEKVMKSFAESNSFYVKMPFGVLFAQELPGEATQGLGLALGRCNSFAADLAPRRSECFGAVQGVP